MEQADKKEFLEWTEPVEGQAVIKEEDHKSLQAAFTKTRQREIALEVKLASKDKKSILEIEDKKLQDKVIKEIYWLNNLEELKLIHWETFYKEKEEDAEGSDDDRISKLEKELKLSKYYQSKLDLDWAIDEYKKANPLAFEDEWVEDKIIEELKYISSDLSTKERVRRAATIVLGNNSNIDVWYAALKQNQGNNNKVETTIKAEAKKTEMWTIFDSVIASHKRKEEFKKKFN